jgi:hypothetical protein
MSNLVLVEANHLIDASLGTTVYTNPTGPVQLALVTVAGSNTAAGTEVANAGGSSYARQTIAFNGASAGSATNSGTLNFTNMPATTTVGVEIWDSTSGTKIRRWFGALTASKTTSLGDTLSFAAGSITVSLS